MQKTVDISKGFFLLNDIDINGKKSEVITINANQQPEEGITMGSDNHCFVPAAPNQLVRYLGVWFSSRLSRRHQERIATNEIKSLDNIIRPKHITIDQVVYINNRVLIPRLEYRLCTTLFSIITARKLYTPLTKVAKQLLQLPSSAHTNVLTHPGLVGFLTLEQNQLVHHFTEFSI